MTGRWVHDHPRRFVHDDEVRVLEQNRERNVLWHGASQNRRRLRDLDFVSGTELGTRFSRLAVYQHMSFVDEALDLGTSELEIRLDEKVIESNTQVRLVRLTAKDMAGDQRFGRQVVVYQIFDLTWPLDFTSTSTRARS